jgi:hypothetical protein
MGRILGFLGATTVIVIITAVILRLGQYPVAAAIFWTVIAAVWLILIIAAVWVISSWWTARTMERGAGIALRAQQTNDAWDARKTDALAQLMKEGIKAGQWGSSRRGPSPTLPLPSQEAGWLPALSSFNTPQLSVDDGPEIDETR